MSINVNNIGYSTEDIMRVLQRAYDETGENRDRALKLYDHMEQNMITNKGDLVVLSQMADRYLEQATRQTELLVRLVGVMQKLKQFDGKPETKGVMTDVNQILEFMDKQSITPFTIIKHKPAPYTQPSTGDPPPGQEPTTTSGDNDIQIEAEL